MQVSDFNRLKRIKCTAFLTLAAISASAFAQAPYAMIYDDFKSGLSVGSATSKWFYFGAGPFVGSDGVASQQSRGIRVAPPSINPLTGKPQFSLTTGQETDPVDNPFGLPGGFDHVKWLIYANVFSSHGFPGFDVTAGQTLRFDAWVSGESYGNELHPFGPLVADPDDDIRLACAAMPTIDFENFLVADFFVTNKQVYVLYERLPFGRSPGNNYASFTYAIPVKSRKPHQQHKLSISYEATVNDMVWLVDDVEVFRVDKPGHRLPSRQFMILDHGGDDIEVFSRQRNVGFGLFTLLDAAYPGNQALVKLSVAPMFYFDTATGSPTPQSFFDNLSAHSSRLWGAGAAIEIGKVRISSQ